MLDEDTGDLWDTGQVESDDSIQVEYGGKPLASHAECFWKVRVWDKDGKPSDWSPVAKWSMGLLAPDDWKAKWIGLDGEEVDADAHGHELDLVSRRRADQWRCRSARGISAVTIELPADRAIKRAKLLFTGDNECRAFVNGADVGGRDNFKFVKDADVTSRLKPGKNEIAVSCNEYGHGSESGRVCGAADRRFRARASRWS